MGSHQSKVLAIFERFLAVIPLYKLIGNNFPLPYIAQTFKNQLYEQKRPWNPPNLTPIPILIALFCVSG